MGLARSVVQTQTQRGQMLFKLLSFVNEKTDLSRGREVMEKPPSRKRFTMDQKMNSLENLLN